MELTSLQHTHEHTRTNKLICSIPNVYENGPSKKKITTKFKFPSLCRSFFSLMKKKIAFASIIYSICYCFLPIKFTPNNKSHNTHKQNGPNSFSFVPLITCIFTYINNIHKKNLLKFFIHKYQHA